MSMMKNADVTTIGIAMGDPAGISGELLAKLLGETELLGRAAIAVIGDLRVLRAGAAVAGVEVDLPVVGPDEVAAAAPGQPVFVDLGHLDPASIPTGEASAAGGAFAMRNFREVLLLAKAGLLDGVMFTPFNKLALKLAGNPFPDEIRWAADVLGWTGPCSEYNRLDGLWNARVTSHEPLGRVAGLITKERVLRAIQAAIETLRTAGVASPRLAVAALNPHAGEGGLFGMEEIEVIEPVVREARRLGLTVDGPFPSDTVWLKARRGEYDVVLSMYHDQGQIALKLMGFERGVTILGGFPVPIATPAHGTAYDIAGQGIANHAATMQAFETLLALAAARRVAAAAA
jgi:4-hydroxythreonine-4-phosphate dehydrogenase